ncbi:hypothetical protein MGYG_00181 [Nannizzia gypsea CBS 118893]|uniref:Trichodiene oxygenase n=1 Tax=Arthroderma gypseum (strain ATCC MYA-4604 / CBS 118893) TaxID=535722 RepID=E5R3L4_ARTGP|nr:hypothetical protein MGYG_00181 [Nannizzia gypsea CBS 118893]EFQ97138.1 hypothetical protein MGYG_00181 [Nannizzia gypsea CBS 118893]
MGTSTSIRMLELVTEYPATVLGTVFLLYLISLAVYRLFLHPLAGYPGRKLAALSVWYEFFYDGIQKGRYTFEIQRMHEEYGPIVRISPDELHVNDPGFISELYAGPGKRRDKYPYYSTQFGLRDSVGGTPGHDLHRLRRSALNQFFSKAAIAKLEPMIQRKVEKLAHQFERHAETRGPIPLTVAFSCMTTDIVTEYAFANSYDFLDSPTFEPNFHEAISAGSLIATWQKQFPWLIPAINAVPQWILRKINSKAAAYAKWQQDMRVELANEKSKIAAGEVPDGASRTIFRELLTGPLPEQEKRLERIWQEGQLVVGAGTETTAWALTATLFYILDNPAIVSRLRQELNDAIPDPNQSVSWTELENLPYLNAVISEGFRLSYGLSTRLQRINPIGTMHFKAPRYGSRYSSTAKTTEWVEYDIPKGTPVGMTSALIHVNPDIFPDPYAFNPDRWLDEHGKRHRRLDEYLLNFSKGSRQCIGINLARAEVYMGIGLLIRRLGDRMKLFECTKEDVEVYYDRFVPTPKNGSKRVRVMVTPN